jgi:hypothetical protein
VSAGAHPIHIEPAAWANRHRSFGIDYNLESVEVEIAACSLDSDAKVRREIRVGVGRGRIVTAEQGGRRESGDHDSNELQGERKSRGDTHGGSAARI